MKAVIGGQMEKDQILKFIQMENNGLFDSVEIKSDIEAAMMIQQGQAQYYFGACNTGGGGALALAISILGIEKCLTVGMPGKRLEEEQITQAIVDGKQAFGFTPQDIEWALMIILTKIREIHQN